MGVSSFSWWADPIVFGIQGRSEDFGVMLVDCLPSFASAVPLSVSEGHVTHGNSFSPMT
jgi:hypothetical protein